MKTLSPAALLLLAACLSSTSNKPVDCVPKSCEDRGATCGLLEDSCGATLGCGECNLPETCGGGGIENRCGIESSLDGGIVAPDAGQCAPGPENTPAACSDGCSNDGDRYIDCNDHDCCDAVLCGPGTSCYNRDTPDAGTADAGRSDAGSADAGCPSGTEICASQGKTCDLLPNRYCGYLIECGSCVVAGDWCGGGGVANVCGQTPCVAETDAQFCARHLKECGALSGTDNCGSLRSVQDCGGCASPDRCGGGGVQGRCGCDGTASGCGQVLASGGPLGDLGGAPAGSAWPMFGRSPTHQFRADFAGPQNAPSAAWTAELGRAEDDSFISAPVVGADGTIHVALDMIVYTFSSAGTPGWQFRPSGGSITGELAVRPDGVLYVPYRDNWQRDHHLGAVQPGGQLLWSHDCPSYAVAASPVVRDDGTILTACGNELVALKSDGSKLWSTSLSSSPRGPFTLHPSGSILVTVPGAIVSVSATGAVEWKTDVGLGTEHPLPPSILADGTILVVAPHAIARLTPKVGAKLWHIKPDAYIQQPAAIGPDGHIYVVNQGLPKLIAFDSDGKQLWSRTWSDLFRVATFVAPPVVDSLGNVFVWPFEGTSVYASSTPLISVSANGTERWTKILGYGSRSTPVPVSAGRMLGVMVDHGDTYKLVALE